MTRRLIWLLAALTALGAVLVAPAAMADEPIVLHDLTQHELRLDHAPPTNHHALATAHRDRVCIG